MCGISALISDNNIFELLYENLFHLQHRGQNSFGFAISNINIENQIDEINIFKENGLISNSCVQNINGNIGIGHVRYPTSGNLNKNEIQPFVLNNISLCHNGNIANYNDLKKEYKNKFIIRSESDSELFLNIFIYELNKLTNNNIYNINSKILYDVIKSISQKCKGGYSVIILIPFFGLVCFKDPYGIRPLVYGKYENTYAISSESSSIMNLDNNFKITKEINGGEIVIFKKENGRKIITENYQYQNCIQKPCIFEWIYIARDDSIIHNVSVYKSRLNMGKYLANKIIQENIDINSIDVVIPVPDTSRPVALKLAEVLKKPYREAIIKNRYVARTFIMDNQKKRKKNIKRKLSIIDEFVNNKNILIVDDSIVRGNTISHIIENLYNCNAKSIIVASSAPIIKYQNFYGLDIPTKEELIANNKSLKEIETKLNIRKLIYLSINDTCNSITDLNPSIKDFELSVFNGKYIH